MRLRIELDQIRIASPCTADWEAMVGDERVRHCVHCDKNVYNLAVMQRREIEQLVIEKEGRLCGRFYQRQDGTMLTADCPVGLRALRWARAKIAAAVIVVFSVTFSATASFSRAHFGTDAAALQNRLQSTWMYQRLMNSLSPPSPMLMGEVMPGQIQVPMMMGEAAAVPGSVPAPPEPEKE